MQKMPGHRYGSESGPEVKLAAAMKQAVENNDAAEFGRIADFCRHTLGWKHDKLVTETCRVAGCEPATVDGLLYEADEIESNT